MPKKSSFSYSSSSPSLSLNTKRTGTGTGKKNPKTLSPTVRQAARASGMYSSSSSGRKSKGGRKGALGKKKNKKGKKPIGHRMERLAPPGGRTTIDLGGYGQNTDADADANTKYSNAAATTNSLASASASTDSPSSVDVNVPRYSDGKPDGGHSGVGGATFGRHGASSHQGSVTGSVTGSSSSSNRPHVQNLPLGRPKTSAPTRKINHGGHGHEYTAYNPYSTQGNVITIDDLPTDGLMITTPRGIPLKDCVNATRRDLDVAAARWKAPNSTRVGGNAARSARHLRDSQIGSSSGSNSGTKQIPVGQNEFGSGARRLQPPGGHSTFQF